MGNVVEAVGLTKEFRDFWNRPKAKAVNDIDFEVREGEVLGLLGPNGSGKSTTVKMLLGLLYPTGGRLTVFGRSPRDVDTKKMIGYLPEETYLYKYLTAAETLDFFASLFNLSAEERRLRTEQLLDMVGLAHARNRQVGEFSKGMARRIGLAQAMINDPSFLILDEPTSGLDPIGCKEVKDLIRLLKKRGKTVIVTSHLLGDVEDVCESAADLLRELAREYLMRGEIPPKATFGHEPSHGGVRLVVSVDATLDDIEKVSAAQAAELLGVSRSRVTAMLHSGLLEGWKDGRNTWVTKASIDARLASPTPAGRPKVAR